jgi:hypothetical protein
MGITLNQIHSVSAGSTRLVRVNCTRDLDSGVSLTGTPTVVEVTTTALTLASKAVNTATYVESHSGTTVAIGKAVEFTVTGGVAGTTYTVRITVSTTSTPAETLVYDVELTFV